MKIRLTIVTCVVAMLLCASSVSAFDDGCSKVSKNWGTSFRAQKKAQIANPDAGSVTGPVEDFDGIGAEKAMDAYHESFSQQDTNQRQGYSLDSISVISGGGR